MSEETPRTEPGEEVAPAAEVRTRRGFSIVWAVPLAALLIGGWLAYKALSEKGPTITITFKSAEGLEDGKTKVKFKDVEVGKVTGISLSEDFSHVEVTAEMNKRAEPYLTDRTRFWVVRARLAAGEVSGLGTLFSGAYIGVDPKKGGLPQKRFQGLEIPPVLTEGLPGRHFTLRAADLGSLDIGIPVYYRKVKVGKVVSTELDPERDDLKIRIFVEAPFDGKVTRETRFYNASGIDVALDASGVRVNTESLVSILLGGIAFETPVSLVSGGEAPEGFEFQLYPDRESTKRREYARKVHYLLQFKEDVGGLSHGSLVKFHGIQVGRVVDFSLQFDWKVREFQVPVLIEIEPERIGQLHGTLPKGKLILDELVERGLRAQLRTGNLITGQKFIDLDFHPEAPPAKVRYGEAYPVVPTVPQPLEEILDKVQRILVRLEKVPVEEIGRDAKTALESLDNVLRRTDVTVARINEAVLPELTGTLRKVQESLAEIEKGYGPDSGTNLELRKALDELAEAARSIRILTEYLQRHPESLIRGKGDAE